MQSDKTEWFPKRIRPTRRGVYQTSQNFILSDGESNLKDLGHGYAFYDGEEWRNFNKWGNHIHCLDMVWRGLASERAAKRHKGVL